MKLIFIYGPPGAGKLTVAKELKKITGYKIFHNHLTVDLLMSMFEFGTKKFFELSRKIRLHIFEAAAKQKLKGMIFTYCYSKPHDNKFVKQVIEAVEKNRGKVCFVNLRCSKEELFKRIKSPSRKKFRKIKDSKELEGAFRKWNLFSAIPFRKSLVIDNTNLSPKKAALEIKSFYRL